MNLNGQPDMPSEGDGVYGGAKVYSEAQAWVIWIAGLMCLAWAAFAISRE